MKILKLIKDSFGGYKAVFDKIPETTYEKIDGDYVGSYVNENGDIIASHWLERKGYGDAFGGREIGLKMKDGSTKTIKDYWFDSGTYPEHGDFVGIGAGTLEGLKNCYVYFGYYINAATFQKMVDEYLKYDKLYGYWEVEDWCNLQYRWYDVVVNNTKIPYMMNFRGDMVEKESKKRVYARRNVIKKLYGSLKEYQFFRFEYEENGILKKIHANYLDTLKATLPYTEEEIRKNCNLPSIEEEKEVNHKIRTFKLIDGLSLRDKKVVLNRLKEDLGEED